MAVVIASELMNKPKGCESCPFLNNDLGTCELLSRMKNNAVLVNRYSKQPDKRCPIFEVRPNHGRLLDERDIRTLFTSTFPFMMKEVRFSMQDIFNNIEGVQEVVPEDEGKQRFKDKMISIQERVKNRIKKV